MNSSKNYLYSSNRNYRHCIKSDVEEKIINDKSYYNPSFSESNYSSRHESERMSQINNDRLNNFQKLLDNLSALSAVANNFFNVLQGILGISIDTLFTDYSYTNIVEIDKRLQMILKTLMGNSKIPYKTPHPNDCYTYDTLREYILFDTSKTKFEHLNVLSKKNNDKDFPKINELSLIESQTRSVKNLERDQLELSIRLANCKENEMYRVSAVNHYENFKEEPTLFETDFQLSEKNGVLNLLNNLTLNLFYERKQYIKFYIFKKDENKKFTVKFPIIKLLMSEKEELEYVYNKETNEKLIINSKILNKSKVEMELQVKLTNKNLSGGSFNYSYSLIKQEDENNVQNKENEIYTSELKNFSNKNSISFRNCYMYFNNYLNNDMNKLFLGQKLSLCIFKSDIKKKNAEKTFLKEISLPSDSFKNSLKIILADDLVAEINLNYKNLFTFSQFLKRGLTINLRISIDFTKSNGKTYEVGGKHELNENVENPYKRAIKTCGEIVSQYDYDKIFQVYGYGAILPNENFVSHCFNLNLTDDPNIKSIQKVLEVYVKNAPKLLFKFPTYFSHSIRKVIDSINENVDIKNSNKCYEILLILTDGKVGDFQETVKAIVQASRLPMSIVIIGIGDENFESMHKLECEEELLVDIDGIKSIREIVNFVPFSKYEHDQGALAEAVFDKIPTQIVEYYTLKKIRPQDLK